LRTHLHNPVLGSNWLSTVDGKLTVLLCCLHPGIEGEGIFPQRVLFLNLLKEDKDMLGIFDTVCFLVSWSCGVAFLSSTSIVPVSRISHCPAFVLQMSESAVEPTVQTSRQEPFAQLKVTLC